MENITTTVKEKMQKVYSFTGTQLLITGIWIIILLSIVSGIGTGKWHMKMKSHMMKWNRQEMMQHYDRQGSEKQQRKAMRWQSDRQQPMMNSAASVEQSTPPSTPTGTGN